MKLAFFSAFPQELTYIIKNLGAERVRNSQHIIWTARAAAKEIIIVLSGMGTTNSEAAWKYVHEEYRPDYIISVGFGGALYDGAGIGDLIAASGVLLYPDADEETAHRRRNYLEVPGAKDILRKMTCPDRVQDGTILTLKRRVNKSAIEKDLLQGLPFPVCDMETFPLAKLSIREGLPFCAIRAVTDRAHEDIPEELFGVTDSYGNYNLSRALRIILGKPALIPSCIRMAKNARLASRKLWQAVEELIRVL